MRDAKQRLLSQIPPVNQILDHPEVASLVSRFSRELVVAIIQQETERYKRHLLKSNSGKGSRDEILQQLAANVQVQIELLERPSLRTVLNATGIILHTGLGRAPLSKQAQQNLHSILPGYCNLELDLEAGKRGERGDHVEKLLCLLTGAEAACVVNNNAAAVLLTLNTLSFGQETIISRGQLIEIGGSFRMPEVMQKSGAIMREVGATNKTHLKDYEEAVCEESGLICVVHPSNYRVRGFVAEVPLAELVGVAHQNKLPIFQDLGGGVLIDLQKYGLPYEPVVSESVRADVDVITFSGDKVLGGPQSGIIVGKKPYVEQIRRNPLMRAVRCDKLIYAALEATLKPYLNEATLFQNNDVLRMLIEPVEKLQKRVETFAGKLSPKTKKSLHVQIESSSIQIGSGAMPLEELPSRALSLRSNSESTESLARRLRLHEPPIIGYIREDKLFLDFRTLFEDDEPVLLQAIENVVG